MKQQAEKNKTHTEYVEGDWVILKLQLYRQTSVEKQRTQKLSKCYFGPFKILNKISSVAYKLDLPPH